MSLDDRRPPAVIDGSRWSGEGDLTVRLVDALSRLDGVVRIRVEDARSSGSGAGYTLIANEIFVSFAPRPRLPWPRWLRAVPGARTAPNPGRTLAQTADDLAAIEAIGPADYTDEGMLQYLRAERVVQPGQTRGFKQLEMVRVYAVCGRQP